MAARRAREKESPEKKAARNEAKRLADRIKRKNETTEERELRRKRNREAARKWRENLSFVDTRERVRSYTPCESCQVGAKKVRCLTKVLLEAAGVTDVKLKYRACLYGSPSDSQWLSERYIDSKNELHEYFRIGCGLPASTQDNKGYETCQDWPIGLKMYAENGDDMGAMKGWVFGSYGRTPLCQP